MMLRRGLPSTMGKPRPVSRDAPLPAYCRPSAVAASFLPRAFELSPPPPGSSTGPREPRPAGGSERASEREMREGKACCWAAGAPDGPKPLGPERGQKKKKKRRWGLLLGKRLCLHEARRLSFPRGLSLLIGELSCPRWLGEPAPFLRGRLAFFGVGGTAGGSGSPKGSGNQIFGASLADLYSPSRVGKLKWFEFEAV